jgi:uncharacterized protein YbbC (DUF1343 family)
METQTIQTLSTLTPAVAVAVIFAYVITQKDKKHAETVERLNAENLENHKAKTLAFLTEITQEREMVKHIIDVHAQSLKEFATSQQQLSKSIDLNTENLKLNTEVTKDMREALRKM